MNKQKNQCGEYRQAQDAVLPLTFDRYEVKTLLWRAGELWEHDSMLDL